MQEVANLDGWLKRFRTRPRSALVGLLLLATAASATWYLKGYFEERGKGAAEVQPVPADSQSVPVRAAGGGGGGGEAGGGGGGGGGIVKGNSDA